MTLSCLGAIKTVLTLPARHSAPLARLQERKSGLTSVDSCIQVTSHTTDISQDWPWAWRRLARPCSSPTKAGLLALDPLVPLAAWGLVLSPTVATGAMFIYTFASPLLGPFFSQPGRIIFLFPAQNLPELQCNGRVCNLDLSRIKCSSPFLGLLVRYPRALCS